MKEQKALIDEEDWDVILWLDAGRLDYFKDIIWWQDMNEVVEAYNGGFAFTPRWTEYHFDGEYDAQFYSGGQPIGGMLSTEYDEEEHFREVIPHTEFEWDTDLGTCTPDMVRETFDEHWDGTRAVVRFICPHPPFVHLNEYTRGKNRIMKTSQALASGDITQKDIEDAYHHYYQMGIDVCLKMAKQLEDKTVIMTSDHGEYLGEGGRMFHGPDMEESHEMNMVPWLEVEP